jgi:hypothetical protein
MHACYLCGGAHTADALCKTCLEDLKFLEVDPPSPTATQEDVRKWAKENNVRVFSCGKKDMGVDYEG